MSNNMHGQVIDDPDTVVLGHTITQWSEAWVRWAFSAPATENAFNDSTGTVARDLNDPSSRMYFITGARSSAPRTFDVTVGKSVLVPMNTVEDSEGLGITPTRPGFVGTDADQVNAVLKDSSFTNGSVQLDGQTITNVPVLSTDIFSAGVVAPGSEAEAFFGSAPGTSLQTSGVKGYWIVLRGLNPGQHTLTTNSDFRSPDFTRGAIIHESHTDIINVVLPT